LRCGLCNVERGASNIVFLTPLGGGAFGNRFAWIRHAIRRVLDILRDRDLDVRLVSYGTPSDDMLAIVDGYQ
jgi:hypothetical protein